MRGGGRGDEAPCDFSGWRPRCDDLRRVRSSCIRKGHLVWVNVGHSPTQRPSSATSPRLSTTAIEHTGTFKRHASERHDKSQSRTYIGTYTYIWGRIHVPRSRYPDRKGLLFVTSARLVCRVSALNYPDTRYDLDSLDEASKLAWKRPYASQIGSAGCQIHTRYSRGVRVRGRTRRTQSVRGRSEVARVHEQTGSARTSTP